MILHGLELARPNQKLVTHLISHIGGRETTIELAASVVVHVQGAGTESVLGLETDSTVWNVGLQLPGQVLIPWEFLLTSNREAIIF